MKRIIVGAAVLLGALFAWAACDNPDAKKNLDAWCAQHAAAGTACASDEDCCGDQGFVCAKEGTCVSINGGGGGGDGGGPASDGGSTGDGGGGTPGDGGGGGGSSDGGGGGTVDAGGGGTPDGGGACFNFGHVCDQSAQCCGTPGLQCDGTTMKCCFKANQGCNDSTDCCSDSACDSTWTSATHTCRPACVALGDPCTADSECCSAQCLQGMCAATDAGFGTPNTTCVDSTDCNGSMFCLTGACAVPAVDGGKAPGASCTSDSDCQDGQCWASTCQANPATCSKEGSTCKDSTDCCGALRCQATKCAPPLTDGIVGHACYPNGSGCKAGDTCCGSLVCTGKCSIVMQP